jgi:uncharacterized membrane protein YcaP (DUF421 family)
MGDIMQIVIALLKMGLLYFIIIGAYRLLGKRHISELSIMDLIVFLLLSNIITLSLPSTNQSFFYMSIIIAFLIALQVTMTYLSSKFPSLKYMFNSKPSMLIKKGKLDYKEMIKRRYNLDDLLMQLREKSIKNIEDVEYAILENNGKLSTFGNQRKSVETPIAIILDGQIQHVSLKLLHKN